MKVHFNVTGPLIWLDENGETGRARSTSSTTSSSRAPLRRVGIGADYIDNLFRYARTA